MCWRLTKTLLDPKIDRCTAEGGCATNSKKSGAFVNGMHKTENGDSQMFLRLNADC
jgi:hypothetical protein